MSEPHTADLGARYRYRQEGAELERERIIRLIQETYSDSTNEEWGSLEWTGDIIALIKGEQK